LPFSPPVVSPFSFTLSSSAQASFFGRSTASGIQTPVAPSPFGSFSLWIPALTTFFFFFFVKLNWPYFCPLCTPVRSPSYFGILKSLHGQSFPFCSILNTAKSPPSSTDPQHNFSYLLPRRVPSCTFGGCYNPF